jgi:lipopolysaccharide biosynthesis glycosyltransferase
MRRSSLLSPPSRDDGAVTAELHVACAAEGSYVPHSAAMLHSLLANGDGRNIHVHYLHGPGFPARARRRLEDMVDANGGTASFRKISDDTCAGLPTRGFTRKATWYRIFLPELLPGLDRVLYLDADLIVLDSLVPLWETDLAGHYLAAVTNVFQSDHLDRPAYLGLEGPRVYFNAGVMLMNLALMRRDGATNALLDFGVRHRGRLDWRDQDAMNVVLGKRRLALPPRWNVMNSILEFPASADVFAADALEEARRHPAIRHFEGPSVNKPWHYMCERDMRELYIAHRRETPWPRVHLKGVTPLNIVRRLRSGRSVVNA